MRRRQLLIYVRSWALSGKKKAKKPAIKQPEIIVVQREIAILLQGICANDF
jgi:hypothetical protein